MDWMRLTSHATDLSGQKGGGLRAVTMEEVKEHSTEFDAWTVLNGRVYNLTPYLHYHPGGVNILLSKGSAGADCTALFQKYHRWVNGAAMLKQCEIGWLQKEPVPGPAPAEEEEEDDDDESPRLEDLRIEEKS